YYVLAPRPTDRVFVPLAPPSHHGTPQSASCGKRASAVSGVRGVRSRSPQTSPFPTAGTASYEYLPHQQDRDDQTPPIYGISHAGFLPDGAYQDQRPESCPDTHSQVLPRLYHRHEKAQQRVRISRIVRSYDGSDSSIVTVNCRTR